MDEKELYTVHVYRFAGDDKGYAVDDNGGQHIGNYDDDLNPRNKMTFINRYTNMISAKIMNGRMLELEHIRLAGGPVKFKTVINYNPALKSEYSLGLIMIPQKSYISPM